MVVGYKYLKSGRTAHQFRRKEDGEHGKNENSKRVNETKKRREENNRFKSVVRKLWQVTILINLIMMFSVFVSFI